MALATGLIQPGTTVNTVTVKPREKINNVEALKQKLSTLKNGLDWTERLDLRKAVFHLVFELLMNIDFLLILLIL